MKLGPTFFDEVNAAGLGGIGFAISMETGELLDRGELTDEQLATLQAVVAAHDPARALADPPPPDPVEKLRVFLDANPDVKALLGL